MHPLHMGIERRPLFTLQGLLWVLAILMALQAGRHYVAGVPGDQLIRAMVHDYQVVAACPTQVDRWWTFATREYSPWEFHPMTRSGFDPSAGCSGMRVAE